MLRKTSFEYSQLQKRGCCKGTIKPLPLCGLPEGCRTGTTDLCARHIYKDRRQPQIPAYLLLALSCTISKLFVKGGKLRTSWLNTMTARRFTRQIVPRDRLSAGRPPGAVFRDASSFSTYAAVATSSRSVPTSVLSAVR